MINVLSVKEKNNAEMQVRRCQGEIAILGGWSGKAQLTKSLLNRNLKN